MPPPATKIRAFDQAMLAKMSDPLTIRLERVDGHVRTPVELPSRDGQPPGVGWLKPDVQRFEGWVCDGWGGGRYEGGILDDAGQKMDWTFFFPPKLYQSKTPTFAEDAGEDGVWPPTPIHTTPIHDHAQRPMTNIPLAAPAPALTLSAAGAAEYDRRAVADENRTLREHLAKSELEKVEQRHQADLARERQENDRKFEALKASLTPKDDSRIDKLEQLIVRLLDKPVAPVGPDPTILAMQEENRKMREEMQRSNERADAQRREDAMIARMEKQASDTAAALAAINARPQGPDPMLMMLVDLMKNNTTQAQMQMERMQAMVLKPQDILAFTKESSSGLDDMKRSMTGLFTDVLNMQRQVTEQALQMAPQSESPAVRLLEEGMKRAGEMADRYMGAKRDETVSHAKAQAEVAKAQAAHAHAQNTQLEIMAQREAQGRLAEANGAASLNGNGHAPQPLPAPVPVIEVVDATTQVSRYGRTDSQWFGESLAHVDQLRAGVAEYFASVSSTPPKLDKDGDPIGISADMAAQNILRAAAMIVTQKITIPAFNELFLLQRYTEFMDVLLPNAPQPYKADVIGATIAQMNEVEEGDEDDDGDDARA